jgi:hypothetical protein
MNTLACPFIKRSKTIHKLWLESFKRLELDRSEFRLVMLDLAADQEITAMMKAGIGEGWAEVVYLDNPPKQYANVADAIGCKDERFLDRRKCIAETMALLNQNRVGNLVIWEDDIIVPPTAYKELVKFLAFPEVLAVTGVQYSRNDKWPMLMVWDWVENKEKTKITPYPRKHEMEKNRGFEFVGATATGFIIIKEEFIKTHEYSTDGIYGQDVCLGKHINETGKLLLSWEHKFPHIGIKPDSNRLKIYKTNNCKVEVLDEYGTAL